MMDGKRSIQDLIPPARSKPLRPVASTPSDTLPPPPPPPPRRSSGGIGPFIIVGIIVLVVVGAGFGVVSTMFHRASVTIVQQMFTVPIAASFEASPKGVTLSFTDTSVEDVESKVVARTGTVHAEDHAFGTVTVSNTSSSAQRLITNTRFESTKGLIFRIKAPIVVPAAKGGTPGTVETTVYADQGGDAYNIGPTDFTVPGLKGSPQFTAITAHSSGAMSGGFIGDKATVAPDVHDAAIASLRSEADRAVRAKLVAALAPGQTVFPDTVSVQFIDEPDQASGDAALVSVKAIATAPVFSGDALAHVIASEGNVAFDGPLAIDNLSDLSLSATPSKTKGNLTLAISGNARLVGTYDEEALKRDLLGKDKGAVGAILSKYPAITKINVTVYPFWRATLPTDPARVSITAAAE